jgi:hypothetical protein
LNSWIKVSCKCWPWKFEMLAVELGDTYPSRKLVRLIILITLNLSIMTLSTKKLILNLVLSGY